MRDFPEREYFFPGCVGGWAWIWAKGFFRRRRRRNGDSKNTQNRRFSKKLCPKNPKMARIDPFLKNDISQPKMERSSLSVKKSATKNVKKTSKSGRIREIA